MVHIHLIPNYLPIHDFTNYSFHLRQTLIRSGHSFRIYETVWHPNTNYIWTKMVTYYWIFSSNLFCRAQRSKLYNGINPSTPYRMKWPSTRFLNATEAFSCHTTGSYQSNTISGESWKWSSAPWISIFVKNDSKQAYAQ